MKVNRRFGETYRLHFQDRKVCHVGNYQDVGSWLAEQTTVVCSFLAYVLSHKTEGFTASAGGASILTSLHIFIANFHQKPRQKFEYDMGRNSKEWPDMLIQVASI
jgi:hypothetical protein